MGLFIAVLIVLILYLLAIMPRMLCRADASRLFGWYYAHRGLHGNEGEAPENSLAAFSLAVEAGYGIELDVQLSKDRIPVVFHDETLTRVCGVEGRVRDYTCEELQKFTLCNSKERIPLLEEVLQLVAGRVPLIVEIKVYEKAQAVCEQTDRLLEQYRGVYCIESFHPFALRWYKKKHPHIVRGQLSSNFNSKGRREPIHEGLLHYLMYNFLCKPDFIAYDHHHKTNISRWLCRYFYRALSVAWTIRSDEELAACQKDYDLFIFEQFLPEK